MTNRPSLGGNIGQGIGLWVFVLAAIVVAAGLTSGKIAPPRPVAGNGLPIPAPSPELSITLTGANPLELECGEVFEEPGATATNLAGESIDVVVSGTPDVKVLGTYAVTYTATDEGRSVSVDRTVVVKDTVAPTVLLQGPNPMALNCGETFTDPGAIAVDCNGNTPVTVSETLDSNVPGTYLVTYKATDNQGLTGSAVRRVIVGGAQDDPPTINVTGELNVIVECGETFVDPGATASTVCSGAIRVESSGLVDDRQPGAYNINYRAIQGQALTEKARVVFIVDTTAPIISLQGPNPMVIELGKGFIDPGATALDGCVGSFPATASGTVDVKTAGSYTITYTAQDDSNNEAKPITRVVKVMGTENRDELSFLAFRSLDTPPWLNFLMRKPFSVPTLRRLD